MKTRGFTLTEILMVLAFVGLLAAMTIPTYSAVREKKRAAIAATVTTCAHAWGKWSEPKGESDWWNGTWFHQSRACATCGEAQTREVRVSAIGKS